MKGGKQEGAYLLPHCACVRQASPTSRLSTPEHAALWRFVVAFAWRRKRVTPLTWRSCAASCLSLSPLSGAGMTGDGGGRAPPLSPRRENKLNVKNNELRIATQGANTGVGLVVKNAPRRHAPRSREPRLSANTQHLFRSCALKQPLLRGPP